MLKSTLQVLLSKLAPFIIIFLYLTFSNLIFVILGWWLSETTEILLEQFVVIMVGALVLSAGITIIGTIGFVSLLLGPILYEVPLTLNLTSLSKIDREDITYPGKLVLILFIGLGFVTLLRYLDGSSWQEALLKNIIQMLPITIGLMLASLGIVLTTGVILLSIKFVQTRLS